MVTRRKRRQPAQQQQITEKTLSAISLLPCIISDEIVLLKFALMMLINFCFSCKRISRWVKPTGFLCDVAIRSSSVPYHSKNSFPLFVLIPVNRFSCFHFYASILHVCASHCCLLNAHTLSVQFYV